MVKALRFKGDKKKKRKRPTTDEASAEGGDGEGSSGVAKLQKTEETAAGEEDEEGWCDSEVIEDLQGPLIFTFAASSPICLASDAAGKVFASPLTTCSGEDLTTAEPTQVQQVWVVAPVYGSNTSKYSLRSHAGRYLSCDKHGLLSATREAIGPEEEFVVVKSTLGGPRWALQTCRDKFVGVDEVAAGGRIEIRGDAEEVGFRETWTVRLQKRNKKRTRGGKAVSKGVNEFRIGRRELEELAGGISLTDEQVKTLRKARREGRFNEALLDVRVKCGKHDKFAY